MKNKGFTLIELLAVIAVIGIIGVITVSVVSRTLNSSKKRINKNQLEQIKNAARVWGADHLMILPGNSESENTCNYSEIDSCTEYKVLVITLKDLQDGAYIDKPIMIDNEELSPSTEITITRNGKILDYEVDE